MTPFEKIGIIRSYQHVTATEKLILMIIVTHLGNNDFCFVSLTTLMKESCLTRANVVINLNKLISSGLLIKTSPNDEYKSNRYSIDFNLLTYNHPPLVSQQYQGSIAAILPLVSQQYPKESLNNKEKKKALGKRPNEDIQTALINQQEQKPMQDSEPIPVTDQSVKDIYHEVLTKAPKIVAWTDKRKSALKRILKDSQFKRLRDLNEWRELFGYINESDFLMGRKTDREGRAFKIDIDWILNINNLVKIIEGRYENR